MALCICSGSRSSSTATSLFTLSSPPTPSNLSPPSRLWASLPLPPPRALVIAHARRSQGARVEKKKRQPDQEIAVKDDDEDAMDEAERQIRMRLAELPGEMPDFWEGPRWNALGFFIQYLWAFGIGFALIACGIAVATYNEGAADFKQTPVYKESLQSQSPDNFPDDSAASSSQFDYNPTDDAPALD